MDKPATPPDSSFIGTWRPIDLRYADHLRRRGLLEPEKISRPETHCRDCGHLASDHGLANLVMADRWRHFNDEATPCMWPGCQCQTWRPFLAGRGLADDVGLVNVTDAWVEVPLARGWLVAYRIVNDHRTPVVGELRVFPAEADERRELGYWSGDALGSRAQVPRGGITTRQIRKVRVRAYQQHMAARVAQLRKLGDGSWAAGFGWDQEIKPAPSRSAGSRRGRKGRPDEFYAVVAADYEKAIASGSREPITYIARRRRLKDKGQARDMVRQARKRKLLTDAAQGLSGGMMTDRARALLATKGRSYRTTKRRR